MIQPLVHEILSRSDRIGAKFEQVAITPKRYEIAYGLSIGTDLDDLERRNSPYFAFFNGIRQIFRPIISQWSKIDL